MSFHSNMMMDGVAAAAASNKLLDDLTAQPYVAYSLRKIDKDYSGSAIRVRRASDSTEQDIGFTSGGDLDTSSLGTFCSGTTGYVAKWYDQSGNGINLEQSTAANQPKIYESGATLTDGDSSKPAIYFGTASDDWFLITPSSGTTFSHSGNSTVTVWVVANPDTNSSSKYPRFASLAATSTGNDWDSNSRFAFMSGDAGSNNVSYYAVAARATKSWSGTSTLTAACTRDGNTTYTYLNNSASTAHTGLDSTNFSISFLRVGCQVAGDTGLYGSAFAGHMHEVMYWKSVISSTDRSTLQSDQGTYYSIS